MSVGKIVGVVSSLVVVLLIFYVMSQGTTQPPKVEVVEQEVKKVYLSEEEKKLKEMQESANELNKKEVSRLYSLKCSSCHGINGEGRQVGTSKNSLAPDIRGKSQEYMLQKLDDYKNDRVPNTLMRGLLSNATEDELKMLAHEIAGF